MAKKILQHEITALGKALDELRARQEKEKNPSPAVLGRRRKQDERMQKMADNFLKYNKIK